LRQSRRALIHARWRHHLGKPSAKHRVRWSLRERSMLCLSWKSTVLAKLQPHREQDVNLSDLWGRMGGSHGE
jgi:hypothetical protein